MNSQEFSEQLLKQVESAKKYNQIIARAWDDESFKQDLFAEPKTILSESGIEVSDTLTITVVENNANLFHITLPAKPSTELSNEQLEIVQQYSDQFTQQTDSDIKYYQIVVKAWEDDSFKERLLSEPKAVFKEYRIEIPENLEIRVLENTTNQVYFIFPAKLSEELTDKQLEMIAGGLDAGEGSAALTGIALGAAAVGMTVAAPVAAGAAIIAAGIAIYDVLSQ